MPAHLGILLRRALHIQRSLFKLLYVGERLGLIDGIEGDGPSTCSFILVTVKQHPLMAMLAPSVTSSAIAGGSVMPSSLS